MCEVIFSSMCRICNNTGNNLWHNLRSNIYNNLWLVKCWSQYSVKLWPHISNEFLLTRSHSSSIYRYYMTKYLIFGVRAVLPHMIKFATILNMLAIRTIITKQAYRVHMWGTWNIFLLTYISPSGIYLHVTRHIHCIFV